MKKRWRFFEADHLGKKRPDGTMDFYMLRWILKTPWFQIRLHKILRSDDDRALHDHPFNFTSILLSGGYTEIRPRYGNNPWGQSGLENAHDAVIGTATKETLVAKFWPRFSIIRRMAHELHRLALTTPVWTLVFAGPKIRDWGFRIGPYTWIKWDEYEKRFGEGM